MNWRSAALGLAISAIAIWLTLLNISVNPGEVWQAFLAANLWLFLPTLLLHLLNICPTLPGAGSCSSFPKTGCASPQAYAATHLSYLFSSFLPGRLGELSPRLPGRRE